MYKSVICSLLKPSILVSCECRRDACRKFNPYKSMHHGRNQLPVERERKFFLLPVLTNRYAYCLGGKTCPKPISQLISTKRKKHQQYKAIVLLPVAGTRLSCKSVVLCLLQQYLCRLSFGVFLNRLDLFG